jgi:Lon protease-like protein
MDILAQGRAVFRALNLLHEKEYHEAMVDFLADQPKISRESARRQEEGILLGLFQECHTLIYGQLWVTSGIESPWPLSFQMAARLPLELEERQALLEIRAEPDRRSFLIERLNDMLPRLGQMHNARRSAAGNGHSLN